MIYLPVDEVKIYRNSAVVHRKATVGLFAGVNEVILSGVSTTADPDSLRLFFPCCIKRQINASSLPTPFHITICFPMTKNVKIFMHLFLPL